MKQQHCNINSIFIAGVLPFPQLCSQCVPQAAPPMLSAWRTTRVSASRFTTGTGSHAQVGSLLHSLLRESRLSSFAHALACSYRPVWNVGYQTQKLPQYSKWNKDHFFMKQWLASPGFTEQEYEQELRFSQILETAGCSAVFHLQDFLSFLGKVIPQEHHFRNSHLSEPGVSCALKSPWPDQSPQKSSSLGPPKKWNRISREWCHVS